MLVFSLDDVARTTKAKQRDFRGLLADCCHGGSSQMIFDVSRRFLTFHGVTFGRREIRTMVGFLRVVMLNFFKIEVRRHVDFEYVTISSVADASE